MRSGPLPRLPDQPPARVDPVVICDRAAAALTLFPKMPRGMAYLYDPDGVAETMMNMETLVTCPVTVPHWINQLEELVERHAAETGSQKAANILRHWDIEQAHFLQVCPKEMLVHLSAPLSLEETAMPAE